VKTLIELQISKTYRPPRPYMGWEWLAHRKV
jgi:hypothetical protein